MTRDSDPRLLPFTVRLPPDLMKEVRDYARLRGSSLNAVMVRAAADFLHRQPRELYGAR